VYESVLMELGGGTLDPINVMERLKVLLLQTDQIPPVVTIDTGRRIESLEAGSAPIEGAPWLSGRGLIDRLFELQNPPAALWQESRGRFDSINRFLQSVLDDPNVRINIPHDRSTIQVEWPDAVLPLQNMGSGVPQLVILASASTTLDDHLICLEEPETNLHPLQQRKLLRHLVEETSNQYLIATHSAHFLDSEFVNIFHLRTGENGTEIRRAKKPHELQGILADLGYRASDLLQANCVLWVEGPADRIYIRAWLEAIRPDLLEGIHYSIMFYGGKLLNHLSADPTALHDFIDLRKLNRYSGIVIDSDKKSPDAKLAATKQRLLDEYAVEPDSPGFVWVTDCYTIENYIDRTILAAAVTAAHRDRSLSDADSQWANPLATREGGRPFDKIAIAREVVRNIESDVSLNRWDLRARLEQAVDFICQANGVL